MFTYFKILIVLILTTFSVKAEFFTGMAVGYHVNGEKLNDFHPYYGFTYNNFGTITYINSFNKIGFGAFYEFADHKNKDVQFNIKVGATTGYHPKMKYGTHTYHLDKKFFFNDDIMLLVIPGISFYMNEDDSIDLTLLGDSVNVGFTLRY